MKVRFSDLGISQEMCHELRRSGFEEPFEVQRETIPDMMLREIFAVERQQEVGRH